MWQPRLFGGAKDAALIENIRRFDAECDAMPVSASMDTREGWTNAPPPIRRPRTVWLLIGALWLSMALVTIGAAVAIAALLG